MQVREAVDADAEALTDLHLDAWDESYAGLMPADVLAERRADVPARVASWRETLRSGVSRTLVAADPATGRLVGFVSSGPGRTPAPGLPDLEVMALYVRAEVYGAGVGHELLRAAIGAAPAYLWVLDGNTRAIGFYEGQGFAFDGGTEPTPYGEHRRMVRGGS
jgi:GNAT superfamily N-acetyltransferase